ncbi:MAG: SRPBCC domain-containing protein [Bacteroidota bacterium]
MKHYKSYFSIPAAPEEVYLGLTHPLTVQLWTGEPAEMSDEPGTEFSLFDGAIVGQNLEFEKGKKIVQRWYFDGVTDDSIVTIKLHPDKGRTSLELRHENIPEEDYEDIVDGWDNVYMAALREFYEE